METPAIHPVQAAPAIFADASACGGIAHLNPTLRIALQFHELWDE